MPGSIVVTEYISLDGVIEDPVGMEGSGLGNWTGPFSRGPEGDQFKLDGSSQPPRYCLGAQPMTPLPPFGLRSRIPPALPRE
jgi:hypothetical protein